MSVMPISGSAGPLHSQSQSPIAPGAWAAQAGAALWSAVRPMARLVLKAIAEHHTRRAVRDLQHMDDRLLRDIGMTRSTIEFAVRYGREIDVVPYAAEWALWGTKNAPQTFKRPE